MLYPKEYLTNVTEIDLELLKKYNIKGLILDLDNTLIDFDRNIPSEIEKWVADMKQNNIKLCILSNTNKIDKVKLAATKLDLPFIYFAKKPFKKGFKKSKEMFNLQENEIGVVGDQIMTDVIGANLSHMIPILVKPLDKRDYLLTRIKRPIEKIIVNHYVKMKNKW